MNNEIDKQKVRRLAKEGRMKDVIGELEKICISKNALDLNCKICKKYINFGEKSGMKLYELIEHIAEINFLEKRTRYLKMLVMSAFVEIFKSATLRYMYMIYLKRAIKKYGLLLNLSGVVNNEKISNCSKKTCKIIISEMFKCNKLNAHSIMGLDILIKNATKRAVEHYWKRQNGKAIDIPAGLMQYCKEI